MLNRSSGSNSVQDIHHVRQGPCWEYLEQHWLEGLGQKKELKDVEADFMDNFIKLMNNFYLGLIYSKRFLVK